MRLRKSFGKSALTLILMWAFLFGTLPLHAQGDMVVSSDLSGGTAVYQPRRSLKAKKRNFASRRKSKAKRTTKQRKSTRRKVVTQSKVVAKRYRKKRKIKKLTPQEFQKINIELARKSPKEASKIFAGAAEYYIEKDSDYQKAAGYLEEAIVLDPANKDAKLAFSELSVTLGNLALDDTSLSKQLRFRKALSMFEQAVKNDATNALAYVGCAQVYEEQDADGSIPPAATDSDDSPGCIQAEISEDRSARARANYEKALEIDATLTAAKAALGYIYYGDGRIEDSNRLITEAKVDGEENAEIHFFLGLIRYKQGRDKDSENSLRKSISIDPDNAEAHYSLGAALSRMGKDDEAVDSFQTAIGLDPKFINAWFELGVVHYNNERFDEAIEAFDKSVAENTNSSDELRRIYAESFLNLAESYRRTGRLSEATPKYRQAVTLITDDADLFSTFGFVLGNRKMWKEAITMFEKAAEVNPDALAYANLGWVYLMSAKDNKELRFFDREQADLERARNALNTAVGKNDRHIAAQMNLGSVLNRLGLHADAIEPLNQVLDSQKNWLPAVHELGKAYLGAGDFGNAVKKFKKAIDIDKNYAEAYFNLGKAEHMRGKTGEARKAQEKLRRLDKKLFDRLETFFIQNQG